MHNTTSILMSAETRAAWKLLETDPIIIRMAIGVYDDLQAYAACAAGSRFYRLDTADFMAQASRTYTAFGGTIQTTLGGPAAAIRAILGWDDAFPPEGGRA